LRTAQYAWQQAALSENARAVFDVGRELHERLAGMGRHVDRLGKALSSAVTTYNQAVGSLESRVLVSARRFSQLGLVEAGLDTPGLVEETPRALSAPELIAEVAAHADTGADGRPEDTAGLGTSPDPAELTGARYRGQAG
jgi:DNA recombination protein RmuC